MDGNHRAKDSATDKFIRWAKRTGKLKNSYMDKFYRPSKEALFQLERMREQAEKGENKDEPGS